MSLQGVSPIEYISPFRASYTEEILFNMGIALYFLKRYTEAFDYLQQASNSFNATVMSSLNLDLAFIRTVLHKELYRDNTVKGKARKEE